MTAKNPFPGMNPFFERRWRDTHTSLITYLADAVLDLQPLIDQCYERRRCHLLDYWLALEPPLPPADAAWAEQLLLQHQLL